MAIIHRLFALFGLLVFPLAAAFGGDGTNASPYTIGPTECDYPTWAAFTGAHKMAGGMYVEFRAATPGGSADCNERMAFNGGGTADDPAHRVHLRVRGGGQYFNGGDRVTCRGFTDILGNFGYIDVIGFEITRGFVTSVPEKGEDGSGINVLASSRLTIEDCHIHDVHGDGIEFHTGPSDHNIVRHCKISDVSHVDGLVVGGSNHGVLVVGSHNLIEGNITDVVPDYYEVFGDYNVIVGGTKGYTRPYELWDDVVKELGTFTGGDWNASTGVWRKAGVDLSAAAINTDRGGDKDTLAIIYLDGGNAHSSATVFSTLVTAVSNAAKTVTLSLTEWAKRNGRGVPETTSGNMTIRLYRGPHIDGVQGFDHGPIFSPFHTAIMSEWENDSAGSNSHHIIQQSTSPTVVLGPLLERFNVSNKVGEATHLFNAVQHGTSYNNTYNEFACAVAQTGLVYASPMSWQHNASQTSAHWRVFNNGWANGHLGPNEFLFYGLKDVPDFAADYNAISGNSNTFSPRGEYFNSSQSPSLGVHNVTKAVTFTNPSGLDFSLTNRSSWRGAGGSLIVATNSGSNSTDLTVNWPYAFFDGWGTPLAGDVIYKNGVLLGRISVENDDGRLTLTAPSFWSIGDVVSVYGMNDIGAIPFGEVAPTAVLANTGGNNYSVTVTGNVRMVEFLENGIAVAQIYGGGPYTFTSDGGTITARIYCQFAHNPSVIAATR